MLRATRLQAEHRQSLSDMSKVIIDNRLENVIANRLCEKVFCENDNELLVLKCNFNS